ncbi:TolC family protein [Ideonella livida]|uniref:TolC family protein n=1 Tax=Ideonella livida TaxID=2707176 RepID=A0A7C9TMJ5_9BURK|nr:TolC family protein [Ideonella livida]NDY94018.1 TolC family protein [Ideonella livida]
MTRPHPRRWPLAPLCLALLAGPALAEPAAAAPSAPPPAARVPPDTRAPGPQQPGLPALLGRVLARDPQVLAQQALLTAAEARVDQTRSRRWPTLGLAAVRGGSDEVELTRPVDRSTRRTEASLRWNLYNGNADQVELAALQLEARAAALDLQRAREEVAQRLAEAALDLARLEGLIVASARRLQAVEALAQQARRQTELGRASEADGQQAEASLTDARIAHEAVQAERAAARLRLTTLAGEPLQAGVDYSPQHWLSAAPAPAGAGSPPPEADAPTEAERPHAGLQALSLRAEAARARVRSRASLAAPRLDLDVTRRLSTHTDPTPSSEVQSSWQLALRWEMPLGGESLARQDETRARADAAQAELDRQTLAWRAELRALGPSLRHGELMLGLLTGQIERQARLVQAGELQFEAGRRGLQQLLQLRDSHHATEIRWADQWQKLQAARLKRLGLTGGWLPAVGLGSARPDEDGEPPTPAAP